MEKLFPVLIMAAIAAFQFYSNYKKEQEKNEKRKPVAPARQAPAQQRTVRPPVQRTVAPAMPNTSMHQRNTRETEKEHYGSIEHVPEEVLRAGQTGKNRRPDRLLRTLEVVELEEEVSAATKKASFNLREAVINAAILERPHQY